MIENELKPPLSAGLILAPWPNRTGDGRYEFDGQTYQLEITEAARNNANHGFVRRARFSPTEQADDAVTLTTDIGQHPGWPFDLVLEVRFSVGADGLAVTTTARNRGPTAAPFGLGFHTFLTVGDTPVDALTLDLGAREVLPLGPERQLPTGAPQPTDLWATPRPLLGAQFDTPFTATDGSYTLSARNPCPNAGSGSAKVRMRVGPEFGWVQVFIADPVNGQGFPGHSEARGGRAVAIEPMTCPPDALRSGEIARIEPGESFTASFSIAGIIAP